MSLRQKLLLIMSSVVLLAATSISVSLWFAQNSEMDAAAINEAGSLRMQSWRLAEHVVVPELLTGNILSPLVQVYNKTIDQPTLTVLADWNNPIGEQYQQIRQEWYGTMLVMLEHGQFSAYITAVPDYVDRIDALVDALQQNTEDKLKWLYIAMVVALFSLGGISALVLRDIQRHVLEPVGALAHAAGKVRRHDFEIQLPYQSPNELGQLTDAFTGMAGELQRLYEGLEKQVETKTYALSRSNAALELLYSASRTLGEDPFDRSNLETLLQRWQTLLGLEGCYLCLSEMMGHEWLQRIEHSSSVTVQCEGERCLTCLDRCSNGPINTRDENIFPVVTGQDNRQFGFLKVTTKTDALLNSEEKRWLQVFVDILATALNQYRQQEHERRILLMEERTVIARELHDSLAQSLSYQKIQISRLRRLLADSDSHSATQGIVDDLQDGVSSAYRQLRELLVTFRLSMAEGSLKENVERTLEGFIKRAEEIRFELDYQIRFQPVDAHQEVHILQIIREALSNVVQHAQASVCRVCCTQSGNHMLVTVDDNGRGLDENPSRHGHYGLSIIRERAHSLGGDVDFVPSPLGGTRVQLRFATAVVEMNNVVQQEG